MDFFLAPGLTLPLKGLPPGVTPRFRMVYPKVHRDAKTSGCVLVSFGIDANGNPDQFQKVRSWPVADDLFAGAAADALESLKVTGGPTEQRSLARVTFSPDENAMPPAGACDPVSKS